MNILYNVKQILPRIYEENETLCTQQHSFELYKHYTVQNIRNIKYTFLNITEIHFNIFLLWYKETQIFKRNKKTHTHIAVQ